MIIIYAALITVIIVLIRERRRRLRQIQKSRQNPSFQQNEISAHSQSVAEELPRTSPVGETPQESDRADGAVPSAEDVVELSRPSMSYRFTASDHADILSMKDFCVLDVETTGLHWRTDRIVQIGIIKVENLIPVVRFNTLVNPEIPIPPRATAIHGITDKDVMSAPTYAEIADQVFSILNKTTVVGHNVTFDINFIQYLLLFRGTKNDDLSLDYVDTEQYARQVLSGLPNYKLQTLLKYFDIDPGAAHTAYDDAFATLKLFHALRYEYTHREELEAKRKAEAQEARRQQKEAEKTARRLQFASSPLLEKWFCFTGAFSLDRMAMESLVLSVGAQVQEKGVSRNTNYLVKGDITGLPDWALDRKLHKAEALIAAGKPIEIIDESEFLRLIGDAKKHLAAESPSLL